MRRRALVAATSTTLVSLVATAWTAGTVAADENTDLAEAQFQAFLAANTTLVTLDVSCSPLPDAASIGPMICYALLSDRQVASAIAEVDLPGTYRFIPINKIESSTASGPSTPTAGSADAAVLDSIRHAVASDSRLSAMVLQANPDIATVDAVDFFEPTGTIEISVSTSAANEDVRHAIAFAVTEVLSGLWAEGQPARDPAATIQPRLEVSVDGTLYSSAYGMMTAIADGTMLYADWLDAAGVATFAPAGRFDPRVVVKRNSL
jgi:hypothetical protein